jgi:hypothetical protein
VRTLSIALPLATAVCAALPAQAQNVSVQLDAAAASQLSGRLGISEAQLESLVLNQIEGLYGISDVGEFLRLSANAQSMANKGLGADYASIPDGFLFGAAVNLATDTTGGLQGFVDTVTGQADADVPVSAGAQITLMLGYNFAPLDLPGLTIYVHGLGYPLSISQLDGTFFNIGSHIQYRVLGPVGSEAIAQWGGLAITTGYEYSSMSLSLSDTFETTSSIGSGVLLRTVSSGQLDIDQRASTIPIELTTSVRLLYLFTVYGGVGVDFQFGSASAVFDLESRVETAESGQSFARAGAARITVDDLGDPNRVLFRALAGLQLNLGPVRIFGQANVAFQDTTVAVATGLRFIF